MTRRIAVIGLALMPLLLLDCNGPSLRKVHDPSLLDDKVLQQRVEAALARAGSDFKNVRVTADNGTVTLTGTVPSADARNKAEQISQGVYDVKETDNELSAGKPATSP